MLFSIENREDLENLEELASSRNQVKYSRLKDKLGEQIFHEYIKILHNPLTDTIKNTSEKITKTLTETSRGNNKALAN